MVEAVTGYWVGIFKFIAGDVGVVRVQDLDSNFTRPGAPLLQRRLDIEVQLGAGKRE